MALLTPPWAKPGRGAILDRTHPLSRGLVGYWLFNEGAGKLAGDLASGNTGTWQGTLGSQWGAGLRGGVGAFNGTNTGVAVPDTARIRAFSTLSACIWFKAPSAGQTAFAALFSKNGSGQAWYEIVQNNVGGKLTYRITTGASTQLTFNGTATAFDGAWHMAAITYDGATLRGYLDAKADGSVAGTGAIVGSASAVLGIGARAGPISLPLLGAVDAYALWSGRVLTVSDLASLAARPYQLVAPTIPDGVYTGGVGLYLLTHPTGTVSLRRVLRSSQTAAGAAADAVAVARVLRTAQTATNAATMSTAISRVERLTPSAGNTLTGHLTLSRVEALSVLATELHFAATAPSRTMIVPFESRTMTPGEEEPCS